MDPATGVAPGPIRVNVVAVIVVASMGTLKVAVTGEPSATAVAPFAGTVETTVGGGAVVKVHTKLAASGAPVGSFAPVVIVAVNKVLLARIAVGLKVAVVPEYVTAPATGVTPGPVTVKVVPVMVAGFMASLKVAEIGVLTVTAVARFAGTVETTDGGGAVVNVHTKFAPKPTPAESRAPVVIVAVYIVLVARSTSGVNVAVEPENVTTWGLEIFRIVCRAPLGCRGEPAPRVTTPATGPPGPTTVNVPALIVAGFIGSLNVAEMVVLTGTPVAPAVGTVEMTVGR